MKKVVLIFLITFVMVLSACGRSEEYEKSDKTENNVTEASDGMQASTEEVAKTTEATTEATTELTTETTTETSIDTTTETSIDTTTDEPAVDYSDRVVKYELKETDNPYINELLDMSGEYTDSVDNTGTYHYQIPQFNAASESAKALNQRIEADLYEIVESEVFNMNGGYSLVCYTLTYEVFQYNEIVAIVAMSPYPNDYKIYYAYTYDFANDKELTNADLLAMNNMTADAFVEEACKKGEDYFMNQASSMGMKDQEEIDFYLEDAKKATTADLPMYYDENGVLCAYVPFPSIAGAAYYYHLCEF